MIQVGTFAFFKKTKFLSHFPAMIFPSTSDSMTTSSHIWTSLRVPFIMLGTIILLFSRSSQLRRLLEIGAVMIFFSWYIFFLLYFCSANSQIFHSRHTVEERYPGKILGFLFVLFLKKVPKSFRGQKLGQFYHLTVLYSWTLDSLSPKNP